MTKYLFLVFLAGCSAKLSSGDIISSGETLRVRIMCPGAVSFEGFIDSYSQLYTKDGTPLGNSHNCAWVKVK